MELSLIPPTFCLLMTLQCSARIPLTKYSILVRPYCALKLSLGKKCIQKKVLPLRVKYNDLTIWEGIDENFRKSWTL